MPRLYPQVRPKAEFSRSLEILRRASVYPGHSIVKSGLMVGLGEEWHELSETLADLQGVGLGILTIGQYLSPSAAHLPVARYYHPDEFEMLRVTAVNMGVGHVECGPLVRSSYHAHKQADSFAEVSGRSHGA